MTANSDGECECGLCYSVDSPEDCEAHAIRHDWYLNGYPFGDVGTRILGDAKTYAVIDARPGDPKPYKKQFAELAMVAQRETPQFRAGYYASDDEDPIDRRAFSALDGDRAIALLLSQVDTRAWPATWHDDDIYLASGLADTTQRKGYSTPLDSEVVSASGNRQGPPRCSESRVSPVVVPHRMGRPVHGCGPFCLARCLPCQLLACRRRYRRSAPNRRWG